jgi:hypothetical protein
MIMSPSQTTQPTAANSNIHEEHVGDELLTLALVLSNKIQKIRNALLLQEQEQQPPKKHGNYRSCPQEDVETRIYNLLAIVPILEGIQAEVIQSDHDFGLRERWDWNVDELIETVKELLSKSEAEWAEQNNQEHEA